MAKPRTRKKKKAKVDPEGIAHVKATYNNTIISLTDLYGNVICWANAGTAGFIGSRKNTAYAASMAAEKAASEALSRGLLKVQVRVKGPGSGRETAVRSLRAAGLEVSSIMDVTPIPHNGCRPPKQRRV